MNDADGRKLQLASPTSKPPTSWSYWIVPDLLLAGAYPGDPDPGERHRKVQALLDSGVRLFLNLMEEGETNHAGDPFVSYADLAQQLCPDVLCVRHLIRDLSVPTQAQMRDVLDTIDQAVNSGTAVYVHCWGGVGRTGTVIGCWLLRHGLAEPSNVLEVLRLLRQQDRERGYRMSPETPVQRRFVELWLEGDVARSVTADRMPMASRDETLPLGIRP